MQVFKSVQGHHVVSEARLLLVRDRLIIDGKLAQLSESATVNVQEPDTNDADNAKTAEQTSTSGNTEVAIQRLRK